MKRFLKTLVFFALVPMAFVLSIECLSRILKIPKISIAKIQAKAQDLIPTIDSNTLVILGDSRNEWGVKPLVLAKTLDQNLRVVNLSMPGSNGLDILKYLQKEGIYPKLVLIGYTRNYGLIKGHGLDKERYNLLNRIKENISYYLLQNFYVSDRSLINFFYNKPLYFKSHVYDKLGGAIVCEYGNYNARLKHQVDMYKGWEKKFNTQQLTKYTAALNKSISFFEKGGTKVYGIYMPVSDVILRHEKITVDQINAVRFHAFFNFANYTSSLPDGKPDSLYFYDGSHLSSQFSMDFSKMLGKALKEKCKK